MNRILLTRSVVVADHITERSRSKKVETEKNDILTGRMQILIERLDDVVISGKNKKLKFSNRLCFFTSLLSYSDFNIGGLDVYFASLL